MTFHRVLELGLALFPRPLIAAFKVPAQEVESAPLRGVHDAGLIQMQHQPAESSGCSALRRQPLLPTQTLKRNGAGTPA